MKVLASHTCPKCGCCFRKHEFNEKDKKVIWCSNPECKDKGKKYLAGILRDTIDAKNKRITNAVH